MSTSDIELESAALEIVPGKLWALGGQVSSKDGISWLPQSYAGSDVVNCYLLREDDQALLIDTGVAAHSPQLAEQLGALLGDRPMPLSVFLTRTELDAMSGLGNVIESFDVRSVMAGFDFSVNPLECFDGLWDSDLPLRFVPPGESISLGPHREVDVVRPVLRLLKTTWLYDHGTRTLFTSDAFGHVHPQETTSSPAGRLAPRGAGTLAEVTEHLHTKFEWLRDLGEPEARFVVRWLDRIFSEHDVEIIAPNHGCVLRGVEAVQQHREWMIDAIQGWTGSVDNDTRGLT